MRKKRVLYAGIKYSYAKPCLGLSYEYYNFYDSLKQIKQSEVKEFDWVSLRQVYGRKIMNQRLLRQVDRFKPDLVFFTIFREEFDKETIQAISEKTLTYNWFSDDFSRFDNYIKYWALLFSWVSTISKSLIPRYYKIGCKNVIHAQFGCNPRLYKKLNIGKKYDISFVGQTHSNRKRMIIGLKRRGIKIETWGNGWPNGMAGFKKMIKIFNQSEINLNLTTFSFSFPWGRFLPWFLQPLFIVQKKPSRGINARVFEVPSCGGLLLTETAPHLEEFFKIGREIVVFDGVDDLKNKIEYYLKHNEEREKITQAGYRRAIKDHTYKKRFTEIFKKIGLISK